MLPPAEGAGAARIPDMSDPTSTASKRARGNAERLADTGLPAWWRAFRRPQCHDHCHRPVVHDVASGTGCLDPCRSHDPRLPAAPDALLSSAPARGLGARRWSPRLNDDFQDLLAALQATESRFLIVGAHALAVHGVPRATGDLDVWVRPDSENAARVLRALIEFGAPIESLKVTIGDLSSPGMVLQIGLPPRRIDILTEISGVDFDEAWASRTVATVGALQISFLGREAFLRNKRASGRPKDLLDISLLDAETRRREQRLTARAAAVVVIPAERPERRATGVPAGAGESAYGVTSIRRSVLYSVTKIEPDTGSRSMLVGPSRSSTSTVGGPAGVAKCRMRPWPPPSRLDECSST